MFKRVFLLYIIFVAALATTVYSQHFVGVRGGGVAGSVRFLPSEETAYHIAKPQFGVSYKYLGGDKYVGGIEIDLNYTEKAFKVLPRPKSDSSYVRSIRTLELPIMWQPHVYMFKKRARLFINLGPYLAYHLGSDWEFRSKENGLLEGGEYEYNTLRDNNIEYGLIGGAGYSVTIAKRVEVLAEFRYTFGFSDILKNKGVYSKNPSESPMDTMSVSFGVYYKFGKK